MTSAPEARRQTAISHGATTSGLQGTVTLPGDKSISHRCLILGALAEGDSHIRHILTADDVLATRQALAQMGVQITDPESGALSITGRGLRGLLPPEDSLDLRNSGTGCRLLMGAVAGCPITARFIGDASLSRRPMGRVLEPLQQMGITAHAAEGDCLPITLTGRATPEAITYRLPVASAQVKSALLLAGLSCEKPLTVIEPIATRDHTERMLSAMGAQIEIRDGEGGSREICLTGGKALSPLEINVPGDPSSAAFLIVAALLTPGSNLHLPHILLNPGRIGLILTLQEMGAQISIENRRQSGGEEIGDLIITHSALHGVIVPPERAPSMIDEYPVLAIAAACAEGETVMRGIGEMRVKESDRIALTCAGLRACGVPAVEEDKGMIVSGHGGLIAGGAEIACGYDHRIAMSFLTLGLVARDPIRIDDADAMTTSFPDFIPLMQRIGARIELSGI